MLPNRVITIKDQVLKRQTLTEGSVFSERLTGEGLITDLFVRVDATFVNGASTVATLDGILRVLTRISCEIDSEQLFNIVPSEQFNLMNILDGTQSSFTQLATAGAGLTPFFSIHIPLALPRPYGWPLRLATALPAGLVNNFVLRLEAAASFTTAALSTVGTGAFSPAGTITFSIVARTMLLSQAELRKHVSDSGGCALFQDSVDNNAVNTATEIETRFKTGRGVLVGFYGRTATNGALTSTAANNAATTTRLVIGASEFDVDSRHLEIQDVAKVRFAIETMPTGAYYQTLAPHGQLSEGVPLVGVQDARLLTTFGGSPSNGFIRTISHIILPNFYSKYA